MCVYVCMYIYVSRLSHIQAIGREQLKWFENELFVASNDDNAKVCIYMYMSVYVCMYIYVYIFVYLYQSTKYFNTKHQTINHLSHKP